VNSITRLTPRDFLFIFPIKVRIAQRVDFRSASAAWAADRLFVLPPFPQLAERCALIEVESIDKIRLSLPRWTKPSKIALQRRSLAQRLKRW
jgi:hypothetical protein